MPEGTIARDRVDGWGKIADHLKCDVTTAIRWAKTRDLPVHQPAGRRGGVHAYRRELDAWMKRRFEGGNGDSVEETSVSPPPSAPVSPEPAEPLPSAAAEAGNGAPSAPVAASVSPAPVSRVVAGRQGRRMLAYAAGIAIAAVAVFAAYGVIDRQIAFRPPLLVDQKQLTDNGLEKKGMRSDGKRLYFGQFENGWLALAAMPVEGGPIQILWNPPMDAFPMDIAPDGKSLLVMDQPFREDARAAWIFPLDGRAPYKLSSLRVSAGSFSPDGKTIALASGDKILTIHADGTSLHDIGTFSGIPRSLYWSTDGTRLRFILLEPTTFQPSSWEAVLDDRMGVRSFRQLASPVRLSPDFNWSRARERDTYLLGGSPGIWTARYGREWWQPAIQAERVETDHFAASVPDGLTYVAATGRLYCVSGLESRSGIAEFNPRTQSFRYILPGISGEYPEYSRDKRWIAWVSGSFPDISLWIAQPDGSMKKRLAEFEDIELPRWSPDGNQIAFIAQKPDHTYRIYIVGRDGGAAREASQEDNAQGAPTWSPDGKSLAYGNVNCQATDTCAVHTIELATGKVRTIPDSEKFWTARWSPDGRYIAALTYKLPQLWIYDLNKGKWRELRDSMGGSDDIDWSSDSQWIYFAIPGSDAQIARISVSTGKQETVLDLKHLFAFDTGTVHDAIFAVAPDGDLLFPHLSSGATEIFSWRVHDQ